MKNKSFSENMAHGCLALAITICAAQCAFGQITRYPAGLNEVPETKANYDEGKWRWNNHNYFNAHQVKRKALNWKDYNETFDVKQCAIWGIFALSGMAHGMREAYHADPYVFETTWNAKPDGFWGSDAWKRNYENNDPTKPHKHEYFANVGRDVWHTADEFDVFGLSLGSLSVGLRKQPIKYRLANWLLGIGVRTLFARITYDTLR